MLFKQCNSTFLCPAVRNVHLEEMNSLCSMIHVEHPLPTCTWGIGSLLAYGASEAYLHIGHQKSSCVLGIRVYLHIGHQKSSCILGIRIYLHIGHQKPTCILGIRSLLAYWASEAYLHFGHQSLLAYWASESTCILGIRIYLHIGHQKHIWGDLSLLGDIHCVKIHLVTSALESHYRCIVYIRATSGSSEALIQRF